MQDAGENGVNVTVELFRCADNLTLVATTATSGGGITNHPSLPRSGLLLKFSNLPADFTLRPVDSWSGVRSE